jgi:hypothetical protein
MANIDRKIKQLDKLIGQMSEDDIKYALKKVQFTSVENGKDLVNLENLLFTFTQTDIAGTSNSYKGYLAQVIETYLKYNSLRDYGCWLTKAIVDIRTSFIAGEGISVSANKQKTGDWIERFLERNKLNGSLFQRAIKGSEMTGKILFKLKQAEERNEKFIKVIRIPFGNIQNQVGESIATGIHYKVKLKDKFDIASYDSIVEIDSSEEKTFLTKNFIYIVTGGDDSAVNDTGTKVGAVLNEIENYDRASKDLRRSNYVVNRITPDFECKNSNEANATARMIEREKWGIGDARVGTAKFSYKVPSSSAHQNTETELQANAKVISTETGIPVHWIGHVELLSNRATAQTLYETIDNQTKQERVAIQEGLYDLIIKAMEMEIDSGESSLSKIDYDFEVKLPLISFHQFKDNIQALSTAYADGAISINTYRNFIPGVDPIQEAKEIEAEEKKAQDEFKTELDKQGLNEELDKNLNEDEAQENKNKNEEN